MDNPKASGKTKIPVQSNKPKFKFSLGNIPLFFQNLIVANQSVIGIDIGSSYVKALQLQKSGKSYMIASCITRAIPSDMKENPAEKKKFVQAAIKEFTSDTKIKTNLGRLAISGKGVFIFSFTVPSLNKKDLRGLIGLELKKRLPYQLDTNNLSFDFFVTGQSQDEKGLALQITCIAADRAVVDEQIQLLKDLKIRPVAVNAIPDSLGNLLPFCLENTSDKLITLLDIGASISQLNFYRGKNLIFSREIPVGGEQLSRAMAKPVTGPAGTVEINVEEAEKLKRNWGIPLEDEAKTEYLTDYGMLLGEQVSTMLRPTLERLILEITRTMSYYTKTFKSENIEELYITGGSSRLRNMDKFLLYNLERLKKVERLNVLKSVKGWAATGILKQELVMEQAAPHLAVAFGLCLGAGGRINLLPSKEKLEQKTFFISKFFKILIPSLFVAISIWYAIGFANNLNYKKLIAKMEKEIGNLEPIASKVKEYLDLKSKLDQRKELLEKAKGKQPIWGGVLKELSNITPGEVIIQKISVSSSQNLKAVRLTGRIVAKYTVVDLALSQYMMSLEDSPFFSNVELVSSEKDMYSPIPAANFEILCRVVY